MSAPWQPSGRYPDPAVEILDPRFAHYRLPAAAVERLWTGARWAEGPVWFGDGRYLLWSDIPNDRILRWDEETGTVAPFRRPSGFSNGNTREPRGRLVTCEHGGRRVTRTEPDGALTVLADAFDGRRLNSPNDVVTRPDGSVWFTDPLFGILGHYEGEPARSESPERVYRIDGETGRVDVVVEGVDGPNGLAFSPDGRTFYLVESRARPNRLVSAWDVRPDGRGVTGRRVLIDAGPGTPDGLRVDIDGNLWCGWGMGQDDLDGVHVFAPDGDLIGRIRLPERCANLCFGGRHRNRLFMAASQSLYSLYVNTQGAPGG